MLQIVGALILLIAGFAILRLLFRATSMPERLFHSKVSAIMHLMTPVTRQNTFQLSGKN